MEEIINLSRVSFKYEENQDMILKDISLTIKRGEWCSVMGHNGSGKSTLAKLLNGLLLPTNGTVNIDNLSTLKEEELWEIRRRVGFVFQNPDNQIVATTVRDDIAFGLENLGVPRSEMVKKMEESARKVGLESFLDEEPYRLSGGQKQRLAIAGVLAVGPEVMIFDESTSMLDPIGRKDVLQTMQELNKNANITIISVTHDLEEAAMADRMIVLNKGEIYKVGTPEEVFQYGSELRSIGLDLPIPVQIAKELGISKVCLTDQELVEELWKLR